MKQEKIAFIYWFAYYNLDSPSVRYRAKYPLDYFKKNYGINYFLIFPGYTFVRILNFLAAYTSALLFPKKNALIVIQRVHSNFIYANLLKYLVKVRKNLTVYDLDDADYLEFDPKSINYFAKNCKFISAGSKKIADHLSQFNTQIVHTTSPIVDLNITKKVKNKIFTIGWIGGYGGDHKRSLINIVFPAIKELAVNCKLVLIGITIDEDKRFLEKYFSNHKNIQLELPLDINWNDEYEIQNNIVEFDIGIATLIDNTAQVSKSGIKVKQYMNNGIPVLSSNLPENNAIINHGKNGYYCTTSNDFKKHLLDFYNMSNDGFMEFSMHARKTSKKYQHQIYYQDFLNIKKRTQSYF